MKLYLAAESLGGLARIRPEKLGQSLVEDGNLKRIEKISRLAACYQLPSKYTCRVFTRLN